MLRRVRGITLCRAIGIALIAAGVGVYGAALAGRVEDVFRGQIVILKKMPPARFSSQGAFADFLRRNRLKQVWPVKKGAKEWTLQYMGFFKAPVSDYEVKVRFYDVTDGKRFVAADAVMLGGRDQQTISSTFDLDERFEQNRKYEMFLLDSRQVVLAQTRFELRGQQERYSGKVDFSDEEAAGKK